MRRSTAAAFGTLTGAALIVGVRLSVSAPAVTAAPPAVDLADSGLSGSLTPSKTPTARPNAPAKPETVNQASGGIEASGGAGADQSGLKDGIYKGQATNYAYGTIQVSIKVDGGKVSAADATYPVANLSATINPPAIAKLKQETLTAKTANDLNTVSGATLTSGAYKKSLQAALDAASA
jgi:uncharacterized protein with FMN-binding domain